MEVNNLKFELDIQILENGGYFTFLVGKILFYFIVCGTPPLQDKEVKRGYQSSRTSQSFHRIY